MPSASLANVPCASTVLTVPGVGLWHAEVELTEAVTLSGAVELRMLDTAWQGTVIAGASVDGKSRYRIVAGAGGWGRELPPRAYANDAGLTPAKLIGDVASEAGETIDGAPTTRLGPHFDRPRGPASFALNLLAPRAWYARPDGVVTFGTRAAAAAPALPTLERNPTSKIVTLAAVESFAGCIPGAGTEFGAAADVELSVGEEGSRARLYAGAAARRTSALARLIDALYPGLRFAGVHEYRVVTQSGERLNLQPVRSRSDLPDLARVPVRAGVPGVKATHTPGSQVLVAFLERDPTRPVVTGFDAPDQPGWMPIALQFGGPVALGVARVTDPVQAGPFAGVITSASVRVKASL